MDRVGTSEGATPPTAPNRCQVEEARRPHSGREELLGNRGLGQRRGDPGDRLAVERRPQGRPRGRAGC